MPSSTYPRSGRIVETYGRPARSTHTAPTCASPDRRESRRSSLHRAADAFTLAPAKMLGVADRLGSIEPGKVADLIVTTHSPIQTVCQVTHMFIDGVPIDLSNKHSEDYERFRDRPAPELPPLPELRGPRSLTR
ncbi:MAG: amidohydrolase family protein [Planctomycetes bacterium]|nr:amidohydrolase family protein [Planctomycetota bacterium]